MDSQGDNVATEALGLVAEEKKIATRVIRVEISFLGVSREEFGARRSRMRGCEFVPSGVSAQIHQRPVVEAGALQLAIFEGEPEAPDQLEPGVGRPGGAGDRAGV